MPELPEVETVRRDLEQHIVGRRIERVVIDGVRTIRRQPPERLLAEAPNSVVTALRRKGKFLMIDLDGDATVIVHLRMSGQLLWHSNGALPILHTHAQFDFDNGSALHFVDPRTFGELWMTTHDVPELSHIGPDVFTERDRMNLHTRLANRRGNLKALLLNQTFLAGIGNIYADEILWTSRLRPGRVPMQLSRHAIDRLDAAIGEVIDDAVELRGSTLRDARYTDTAGNAGLFQDRHHVYAREGLPCHRCGTAIRRVAFGNRSSHFCARCQR